MNNHRGIFSLTSFKKVLDNILFEEYSEEINRNMTDSNIGGRKKRMAKDHLFIVYGIINSVVNGKEDDIDPTIYDIEKAFDKLWLDECLNDLTDNLPTEMKNDKLSLLHEANKVSNVSIKTPFGLTERKEYKEIVTQGGSWGPVLCSNSTDSLGKKSLENEKNLYVYKKSTKIPSLLFVDDIGSASKCGLDSIENNIAITTQI